MDEVSFISGRDHCTAWHFDTIGEPQPIGVASEVENQHAANKEAHMKERNVRMIETNGIRLKVIVEGSGPLLLLLHGFPQCAYLWRNQIDDLVAAGYQVAVPDQRGYGGSDKPADSSGVRHAHAVCRCRRHRRRTGT